MEIKEKESKEMEYEQAPSGFVKIYDYKEPFMPFREGYGFLGALMFDGESDKVQCHFCGEWFHQLGNHLHKEHNMSASQYKEAVDLRQTTALIGEELRAKMIVSGQERFKNLKPGTKKTEEQKRKISESLRKNTMQTKNQRATCPLQLIDRLQKRAKELGRTPTTDEISFLEPLKLTYGTYTEACRIAGLEIRPVGQNVSYEGRSEFTLERLIQVFTDYYVTGRKMPKGTDVARILGTCDSNAHRYIQKYGRKNIIKAVLFGQNQFHKTPIRIRYTKQELIEIARSFISKNLRMPSTSDCKRGLLPHASRYIYHFGSWGGFIESLK